MESALLFDGFRPSGGFFSDCNYLIPPRRNIDVIGALKIEAAQGAPVLAPCAAPNSALTSVSIFYGNALTDAGTPRPSLFMHPKDRQTGLTAAFPEVGWGSNQHASGVVHSGLAALPMAPRFIRSGLTPGLKKIPRLRDHRCLFSFSRRSPAFAVLANPIE